MSVASKVTGKEGETLRPVTRVGGRASAARGANVRVSGGALVRTMGIPQQHTGV